MPHKSAAGSLLLILLISSLPDTSKACSHKNNMRQCFNYPITVQASKKDKKKITKGIQVKPETTIRTEPDKTEFHMFEFHGATSYIFLAIIGGILVCAALPLIFWGCRKSCEK